MNSISKNDDVWIPSVCRMCFNGCGILVHRLNGVVTGIVGNPDSPINYGKLCPKGHAGIMMLYDPNRVTTPLRRRNPKKGLGEDPDWVPISWEEAIGEIGERLKKIIADDPEKSVSSLSIIISCQS